MKTSHRNVFFLPTTLTRSVLLLEKGKKGEVLRERENFSFNRSSLKCPLFLSLQSGFLKKKKTDPQRIPEHYCVNHRSRSLATDLLVHSGSTVVTTEIGSHASFHVESKAQGKWRSKSWKSLSLPLSLSLSRRTKEPIYTVYK